MNFLGSTTPSDLIASVTTGVQTTGTAIWPLIVLAGIPIAFVVGGFVVHFIKNAISPKMSTGPLGYYRAPKGGGEAVWDTDQKSAKERYDLQHKGFTEF